MQQKSFQLNAELIQEYADARDLYSLGRIARLRPNDLLRFLENAIGSVDQSGSTMEYLVYLCAAAEASYYIAEIENMRSYMNRYIKCSNILKTKEEYCFYHLNLGTYQLIQGNNFDAAESLTLALQFCGDCKDCEIFYAHTLMQISHLHHHIGNISVELSYLLDMRERALHINKANHLIVDSDKKLAALYTDIGDFKRAREYISSYEEQSRQVGDIAGVAYAFERYAWIDLLEDAPQKARERFLKAAELYANNQHYNYRKFALFSSALAYLEEGDADNAESILLQAREIDSPYNPLYTIVETRNWGMVHTIRGELEKASHAYESALELAVQANFAREIIDLYIRLSGIAFMRDLTDQSNRYRKLGEQYRHKLYGLEEMRRFANVEIKAKLRTLENDREKLHRAVVKAHDIKTYRQREVAALELRFAQRNESLKTLRRKVKTCRAQSSSKEIKFFDALLNTIDTSLESQEKHPLLENDLICTFSDDAYAIQRLYPELTPAEIKICLLLKLNIRTKNIAGILFKSVETIRTHRRHIRKKLLLDSTQNLTVHLMSL